MAVPPEVPAAEGGPPRPGPSPDLRLVAEVRQLRGQVQRLRADRIGRSSLDRAIGVLLERYVLPSAGAAEEALIAVAAAYGIDVVKLAKVLLVAPRPRTGGRWFPGRVRSNVPELSFLPHAAWASAGDVLAAVLTTVTERAETEQGDLQLVVAGRSGLQMNRSVGFSDEFLQHFAHVDGEITACGIALSTRRPMSVPDITTAGIFDRPDLDAISDEGVRAVYSVPLPDDADRCVGVVSVHYPRAGAAPGRALGAELADVARQAGRWIDWHRRTAVLDALEDLHRTRGRYP